jgi:hypothetical protein
MTKIAASTSVVQPVGIRSQPVRALEGGHESRGAVSLRNSIYRAASLSARCPKTR